MQYWTHLSSALVATEEHAFREMPACDVTHSEDAEVAGGREDHGDGDCKEGADERHDIRQKRHKTRGRQTAGRHQCAHREPAHAGRRACK